CLMSASEIQHMSLAERFEAMELLWDSLAKSPDQLQSPPWHGQVLAKRMAKVEAGEGTFLTLLELKERLKKR
ncbi:MAG TPA: addiction module protein, partial [Prosthecobacter sp.]|nr:addiction module protein [Prosthecobacter sp.]